MSLCLRPIVFKCKVPDDNDEEFGSDRILKFLKLEISCSETGIYAWQTLKNAFTVSTLGFLFADHGWEYISTACGWIVVFASVH